MAPYQPPPWLADKIASGSTSAAELRDTLARIDARVRQSVALEKEKIAALAWCRANGDPHRSGALKKQDHVAE